MLNSYHYLYYYSKKKLEGNPRRICFFFYSFDLLTKRYDSLHLNTEPLPIPSISTITFHSIHSLLYFFVVSLTHRNKNTPFHLLKVTFSCAFPCTLPTFEKRAISLCSLCVPPRTDPGMLCLFVFVFCFFF